MKLTKDLLNFSLINIDKPTGPTSFTVSEYVKKKLGLSKTSHMGTLDPAVTGVLPITLGRACKLAAYFIKHDKTYVGVLHTHKPQDLNYLQEIINKDFLGKIKQTPPHKSAVKREERERTVHEFTLLESSEDKRDFLFTTKVEGGTYIRKLCSDLGEKIGGAHMSELRRTAAGIFSEKDLYSLNEFSEAVKEYKSGNDEILRKMLIPAEEAIKKVLPSVQIKEKAINSLHTGKPLFEEDLAEKPLKIETGQSFSLFCKERFIAIHKKTKEKTIFSRPEFVYN